MSEAPLPTSKCLACGYDTNADRESEGAPIQPSPGDISICFNCGNVAEFSEILTLRPLSQPLSTAERIEVDPIVKEIKRRGRLK
jgi:hypothetical protein